MSPRELGRQLFMAKCKQLTEWSQANLASAEERWSRGDLDGALEAYRTYREQSEAARKYAGRAGELGGAV